MSQPLEYTPGGYFLTKLFHRPKGKIGEQFPRKVVSLSTCLTEVIPYGWYSPDQRNLDVAAKMGVLQRRLADLYPWMESHPSEAAVPWPYAFSGLDRARDFAREFFQDAENVLLLGTSLDEESLAAFLEEAHGHGVVFSEHTEVVKLGRRPADGGNFMGFEVLGDAIWENHTLLCSGDGMKLGPHLGIRLNPNGLIETLSDAKRAAQWMTDDHGEPCLYLPWRLDQYSWGR